MDVPGLDIPQLDDTRRAAAALIRCALRGDQEGARVILATTDRDDLLQATGYLAVAGWRHYARAIGCPEELVTDCVDSALQALLTGQTT